MAASAEEVAKVFKFSALCESLDRIRHMPRDVGKSKFFRQRALREVLARWKSMFGGNLTPNYFPLVRILANHHDSRKYRMKEVS